MICADCSMKDGLCLHLKQLMKVALAGTLIDGSKLCPLIIASGAIHGAMTGLIGSVMQEWPFSKGVESKPESEK